MEDSRELNFDFEKVLRPSIAAKEDTVMILSASHWSVSQCLPALFVLRVRLTGREKGV